MTRGPTSLTFAVLLCGLMAGCMSEPDWDRYYCGSGHQFVSANNVACTDGSWIQQPDTSPAVCTGCVEARELCRDGACVAKSVDVEAGSFPMGCKEPPDTRCNDDERPSRVVNLDLFRIDVTEVTVRQYAACEAAGVCGEPDPFNPGGCNWGHADRAEHPVNCVRWDDAVDYCGFAGKRLCAEAEWEKAARGADGLIYPWGDTPEPSCQHAVCSECGSGTQAVGGRASGTSSYGALDMAGNVSEWVADWYQDHYDACSNPCTDPGGPASGEFHVIRGGDYGSTDSVELRTSARAESKVASIYYGFRCCADPEPP